MRHPARWSEVLNGPAFVINLDRCPERWAVSRDRLRAAGFADIRRNPAIDALDSASLETGWAACGRPRFDPSDPEFIRQPGKQGCFLSHVLLWKAMVRDRVPFACVFEDDVMFHTL